MDNPISIINHETVGSRDLTDSYSPTVFCIVNELTVCVKVDTECAILPGLVATYILPINFDLK